MNEFNFKDFLSFDKMIATTMIKIIYWIGLVLILLTGLTGVFTSGAFLAGLTALVGLFVGLLVWRVLCELWIVIFAINDKLGHIQKQGGGLSTTTTTPVDPA